MGTGSQTSILCMYALCALRNWMLLWEGWISLPGKLAWKSFGKDLAILKRPYGASAAERPWSEPRVLKKDVQIQTIPMSQQPHVVSGWV